MKTNFSPFFTLQFHFDRHAPTPVPLIHSTFMLNSKDYFDKHLLRLERELAELWRCRYVTVQLDEPIQRGWIRHHTLTAKAADRHDKDILLELLKAIGTRKFRNVPDFRTKRGRGRRRRFVEIDQPLRTLTVGEWDRRRFPEDWMRCFQLENHLHYCRWRQELVFASPHLFELTIEPLWITEVVTNDPMVEERIAEIDRWLWNHHAKFRMERLCYGPSRWHSGDRNIILDRIARRELRHELHGSPEIDPDASIRCVPISLRGGCESLFPPCRNPRLRFPLTRGPPFTTNTTNHITMTLSSVLGTGALILGLLFAAFPRSRRSQPTTPDSPDESRTKPLPDSATVAGVPLRHLLSDHSGPGAVLRDRLSTGPPPDAH